MSTAEHIHVEACRWLATHDARTQTPSEQAAFNRWLDADIRHRVAFLKLQSTFQRLESLRNLRPLDRAVDADLLKEHRLRRPWAMAAAASTVLAIIAASLWFITTQLGWQRYETRIGGFARVVLEDGSVIDLNTNSEVRVRLSQDRREVQLLRGEGRFTVAHNPARAFTVSAAETAVRAVGTAFTVRLRESEQVDVLVSEGTVAIAAARVVSAPPLNAGEAAVVVPGKVSVRQVEPRELENRLAWTSGRLQFRGESLALAVAEFNRYNRRQLVLADPALGVLRVGGNFSATDPDSFAAALETAFHLRVAPADADAIVLRPP